MQHIGKFASKPVVAIDSETPVFEALKMMSTQRISCVIILHDGEPIGIVTERDVVFAANWMLGQPEILIREVMNKPVLTASEDMSVLKAYQIFREHQIRHLVVLDKRLDMVGVFTQSDLLRALKSQDLPEGVRLSQLMTSQVWRVAPSAPARYALSLMARHAISCVVVMEENSPIGMFTERDVVRLVAEGVDLAAVAVSDVMSHDVITTPLDATPHQSIDLMRKNKVRRLIVVGGNGQLEGVLTQTDVGRLLDHQSAVESTVLSRERLHDSAVQPSAF